MTHSKLSYFVYFGLHYSKSPVAVREKFAKAFATASDFLSLKNKVEDKLGHSIEMVPVSTCNRFDICIFGPVAQSHLIEAVRDAMGEPSLTEGDYRVAFDADAFAMLCRIAASLDSLVLGESHILGQLKQAYLTAQTERWCGSEAAAIFTRCFQIAKRVRTETTLGQRSVSVGHAAVDLSRRVVADLKNANILVIGAGEMGKLTAQHFLSSGAKQVVLANRNVARATLIASEVAGIVPSSLEEPLKKIRDFDIVVTATSASNDILALEHYTNTKSSRRGRVSVLVDISVPRNIDPKIGQLDDVFLFNVDDLENVMTENRQARSSAAKEAERIIFEELNLFLSARRQKQNLVQVGRFHEWINELVLSEISKNTKNGIKKLDPEVVAKAIAKKLVTPVAVMAKADVKIDGDISQALENIFQLSEKE